MVDYKAIRKLYEEDEELNKRLNDKIAVNNSLYENQKKTLTDTYTTAIEEGQADYDDALRDNAVQKEVNKYYIKEDMANMGLIDSGLSRSQITANQLFAANNEGKIIRQRQSYVDGLTKEMISKKALLENERLASEQSIRDTDSEYRDSLAVSKYNTDVKAETQAAKAAKEAAEKAAKAAKEAAEKAAAEKKLYKYLGKTTEGYRMFEDSDGDIIKPEDGINPYTGANNHLTYAAEYKDENIGFFSNGYQPKGLKSEGGKFSNVTAGGQVIEYDFVGTGGNQTLWISPNGNYFYWDGSKNQYVKLSNEFVSDLKEYFGIKGFDSEEKKGIEDWFKNAVDKAVDKVKKIVTKG